MRVHLRDLVRLDIETVAHVTPRLVRTYASSLIRREVGDLLLYAVRFLLRDVSIHDSA
jgi:hypothetical protein